MQSKAHWERIYATKPADAVSWFQQHASCSLDLIRATCVPRDASIIDVGGGASTLVDDLLADGYTRVTVLDLSGAALEVARRRLGDRARDVTWLEADILNVELPAGAYDVWHDRAVFHFLTQADDRHAYVRAAARAVKAGGHVIVGTFAPEGPEQCSGLPVMRYGPGELHGEFGPQFTLVRHAREEHRTPFGTIQQFTFCYCRTAVDTQREPAARD